MKTLDRYLCFRMVGALLRALIALCLVYVLIDLLTHRQVDILKYDVPGRIILQYYLNFLPQVIQRVAPFALLISALLVLGDAAQNNEITAVTAGGISLRRFVRIPILIALAFAGALFALNETVGTVAAREAENIEQGYFSHVDPTERKGISWANLSGGWTCHIGKFNRIALTGEEILMFSNADKMFQQIQARRIYWDDNQRKWILEDGLWCRFDETVTTMQLARRIGSMQAPFTETPETLFALEKPTETKSAEELKKVIESADERAIPSTKLRVDYHAKYSQPVLSFVMIWLAIPFAMRLRRGGLAIGFGASVIIAIAYLLLFSIATGLGYAERISPPVAAWSANAIFFALGLILFWRTPT